MLKFSSQKNQHHSAWAEATSPVMSRGQFYGPGFLPGSHLRQRPLETMRRRKLCRQRERDLKNALFLGCASTRWFGGCVGLHSLTFNMAGNCRKGNVWCVCVCFKIANLLHHGASEWGESANLKGKHRECHNIATLWCGVALFRDALFEICAITCALPQSGSYLQKGDVGHKLVEL